MNSGYNSLNFRVAHLNLRSIFTGFQEFVDLVSSNDFDVIAVTETWLSPEISSDAVALNGYRFFRRDRLVRRGGGVGIYVKYPFHSDTVRLDNIEDVEGFETVWVKIKIKSKITMVVGVVYRTGNNVLECCRALDNALPELLPLYEYVTVLGDFNVNLLALTNPFFQLFDTLGFAQTIDEPTRVTRTVSTLLDPIFVNDSDVVQCSGTICADTISDHRLVFCNLKLPEKKNLQKFVRFRSFTDFSEDQFYLDLCEIPWNRIYYESNIDDKVHFLTSCLSSLFELHAPQKIVRVNKPPAPWLTPALKLIMKERDRAESRYKANKNTATWEAYRRLRNFALASVRREKMGYLDFLRRRQDSRGVWEGLRQMNVYSGKRSDVGCVSAEVMSPDEVNDYFLSVFRKSNSCGNRIPFYSNNRYDVGMQFSFTMVSPETVRKNVCSIRSNAAGCDELTILMIKLSLPVILNHLTHIINCCMESGYFPVYWRQSIVCPIPKIKSPTLVSDFRPISLLPVLSKVLERTVHTQVLRYLTYNSLLPTHQSGFRESHSTASALLNLTDNITRALDKNKAVISVSLDYSKAFDVLDHELLCAKLKYLGFDVISVSFFETYLSDRHQRVRIAGKCSSSGRVVSGVPQGSILGPLLFLIYTFDIFHAAANSHVQAYADDTVLLHYFNPNEPEDATQCLNADLEAVLTYSKEHNLKINPDKTEVMLFCSRKCRQMLEEVIKLQLGDVDLSFTGCSKNLGLYIDVDLRFRKHVSTLLQRSYARMKILYANRYILNYKMRKKLCESLILPIFYYCCIVYFPCLDMITKNRLQIVQNTCCRFIFNLRKYDHVSIKINELEWLNMSNTVKLHFAVFLMKLLRNDGPAYLREKLIFRSSVHDRDLRHRDHLTMPQHQTALFRRCFTYNAVALYNSLDQELKLCNKSSLRSRYKSRLLGLQHV